MVVIPAGSFLMGSPAGEGADDEHPQHRVTLAEPFALGKYEVTFEEYERFASAKARKHPEDRGWGRGRRPVINVSWKDARDYAAWLSEQTGKRYRLPTEAEWEYAARAGSQTAYWWGQAIGKGNANCDGCGSQWDDKQTAPVGSFKPNPWGLYDTAGNVWEWEQDCYHDSYQGAPEDGSAWEEAGCPRRVIRGGSWSYPPGLVRSAGRRGVGPGYRGRGLGVRLAQDL